MRKTIYCPRCLKYGIKRRLLEVDDEASGILYCWCKECKKEIVIMLEPMSR